VRSRHHHPGRFRQWFDRGGWFYLYLILTVMIVSSIAVPWVAEFVAKFQGYNATHYEPKDEVREEFQRSLIQLKGQFSWQSTVKLVLLAMVAILWMVAVPGSWRQGRTRTNRR
jgi:hypothetical protein